MKIGDWCAFIEIVLFVRENHHSTLYFAYNFIQANGNELDGVHYLKIVHFKWTFSVAFSHFVRAAKPSHTLWEH